ncbi:MAG TPA: DDE-type integrase/transposase/recombinase [Bacillales bacterium]|nr:DDE-type integrase/transposase/recombinase [Bacillales bacterium]
MSFKSRQEYLETKRQQYWQASSREEKTKLLDEAVNTLGYQRKYLIGVLNSPTPIKPKKQRRSKPLKYREALPIIELVWEALDYPCAERLHPVLPATARRLERFQELTLSVRIEAQLEDISRATLGRYLGRLESPKAKRRLPASKPNSLKSTVPIDRYDWDEDQPGALEIDLVEHNGGDATGEYAYTLNVVDIVTGYSLRMAILGKAQAVVFDALQKMLEGWPFSPWGLHSDNGPEFLNDQLARFCQSQDLSFSRSRSYKKNDNAHVEQKNRQYVREMVGYQRFDTPEEVAWLNDIYEYVDLYANLILPMRKVVSKERVNKRIKKKFDTARTPLQRLVESGVLTDDMEQRLRDIEAYLNPLQLRRNINNLWARGPEKQETAEPIPN